MPTIEDARDTYAGSLAWVPSREELPGLLNARRLLGCAVEVGVKQGEFSQHMLSHWRGRHLISIDPWIEDTSGAYVDIANVPQVEHEGYLAETRARLAPFGSRSSIWRMTSAEGAERIPHSSLDCVYIDARHDFDSVMEDCALWLPKVRPGGILAGHDYLDGDFSAGRFRVKRAVDQFFAKHEIRVYCTLLDGPCVSWLTVIPPSD
jgi:hypothetical protein